MSNGGLLHFFAIALSAGVTSLCISCGQALAFSGFSQGVNRQPSATSKLSKILFYGLFAIELPFVLSFVIAILFFLKPIATISYEVGLAEFGIALGLILSASFVAIAAGQTVKTASNTLARLPQHESKLMLLFMILLTFIETPALFSFITGLLICWQLHADIPINQSYKLFSAALTMGLGSIGPSVAQFLFAQKVCKAVSYRFAGFQKIFSSAIVTEALIESGALFSFMISMLLVIKRVHPAFDVLYTKYVFLAISLCASLGGFASAAAIGYVGSVATTEMAVAHQSHDAIFKHSIIAQILIETCSIFAFVVALTLLAQVTVF